MTVTDAPTAETEHDEPAAGTAVEVAFPPNAPMLPDVPDRNRWAEIETVARRLARSALVPPKFRLERGTPKPLDQVEADLVMVGLYAHDLGLSFTTAMSHINVIEGVPSLSAQAQLGIVRSRGHRISARTERDDKGRPIAVHMHSVRSDTGETLDVSFSVRDAVAKGLCVLNDEAPNGVRARKSDKPTPWELHTEDMLWARCATTLTRRGFSDVLSGMTYTAEELAPTTVWAETADQNDREREPLTDEQRVVLNERWGSLTPEVRKRAGAMMADAAARGELPLRMSDIGAAHFDAAMLIIEQAASAEPEPAAAADDGVAEAEIVHGDDEQVTQPPTPDAEEEATLTDALGPEPETRPVADTPAHLCEGCGTPLEPGEDRYCTACGDPM